MSFVRINGVMAAVALVMLSGSALGQSRQIPAAPQKQAIIISHATVHTVSGPTLQDGYVVFVGGVITDVGRGEPPAVPDARVFKADRMHVYPGLVSADTTLGLVETSAVRITADYGEYGTVTPEVRAAVAINPDSDLIPVARANGILTAMVVPRGGLVSGRCSTVRLDGWTWEEMAIDAEAGLVVQWPRTEVRSRRGRSDDIGKQRERIKENLEAVERLFDDAEAYIKAREADPNQPFDLRYESMRPALAGDKPVFVQASSRGQIESAIAWAVRRGA